MKHGNDAIYTSNRRGILMVIHSPAMSNEDCKVNKFWEGEAPAEPKAWPQATTRLSRSFALPYFHP
jgi:hypothetical protein